MRRSLLVLLVAVAVLTAACSGGGDDSPTIEGGDTTATTAGAPPEPQTLAVEIDAATDPKVNALKFFPSEIKAHAGDTLTFNSHFQGEPHTVALGKTVDAAVAAFNALTPERRESQDTPLPELLKVPSVFPSEDVPAAEIELNQTAAQPCYVEVDDPPTGKPACPIKTSTGDFKGTESLVNSGFLPDAKSFSVKLAADIAPGDYGFMCLVHLTEMTGKLTVVANDKPAQTAAEVADAGKAEIDAMVTKLKAAITEAEAEAKPAEVTAGVGIDEPPAEAVVFAPREVKVPVNGNVTWNIAGLHTVTFGAPADARPSILVGPTGAVQLNKKTFVRVESPEPAEPAEDENAPAVVVNAGRYTGTGFKNSGEIFGGPRPTQYKMSFTRAGTFPYACLIHPGMEGTVVVA